MLQQFDFEAMRFLPEKIGQDHKLEVWEEVANVSSINQLYDMVPKIELDYRIERVIGSGTFSCVFRAVDVQSTQQEQRRVLTEQRAAAEAQARSESSAAAAVKDSSSLRRSARILSQGGSTTRTKYRSVSPMPLAGRLSTMSEPVSPKLVAIKQIYTSAGLDRVCREIEALRAVRELKCDQLLNIVSAERYGEQVLLIMPYRELDSQQRYRS